MQGKQRTETCYGIEMAPITAMKLQRMIAQRGLAMNTLTPSERTELARDYADNIKAQ